MTESLLRHVPLRVEFGWKPVWRRGTVRLRWRPINVAAPTYMRFRRRNPVDHKVVRIRHLEVWW